MLLAPNSATLKAQEQRPTVSSTFKTPMLPMQRTGSQRAKMSSTRDYRGHMIIKTYDHMDICSHDRMIKKRVYASQHRTVRAYAQTVDDQMIEQAKDPMIV